MKSASNTLPEEPLNDVTAGIDWARDDHAVCVVDSRGREVARSMVEHTRPGCMTWSDFWVATASTRSPSNASTGRSSTPCSPPG